jgi:hypothetical protein
LRVDGEAIIDLPPELIKRVTIEPVSEDYTAPEVTWNVEGGEKIPARYVYRMTKSKP